MDRLDEIAAKKAAASSAAALSDAELDLAVRSLQQAASEAHSIDWAGLRSLLARVAHLPHKDWSRTEQSAAALEQLIATPDDASFRDLFQRVLQDGGWAAAEQAASRASKSKPWVVLVTGVNGIRKTSAVYQPWFKTVLSEALAESGIPAAEMPDGSNSFFRQLDYMIATLANEEFRQLYELARGKPIRQAPTSSAAHAFGSPCRDRARRRRAVRFAQGCDLRALAHARRNAGCAAAQGEPAQGDERDGGDLGPVSRRFDLSLADEGQPFISYPRPHPLPARSTARACPAPLLTHC